MTDGTITYRLKKGNPVSWQVPISSMMIPKEVEIEGKKQTVLKKVAYYEGATSIYEEDNNKSDLKKKNIWLEDGGNGFTELKVPEDNYVLNLILQKSKRFGIDFEIYNPDIQAKKENEAFDNVEKALATIPKSEIELRAFAFSVFGEGAMVWSAERSKSELKKRALEPSKDNLKSGAEFILEKSNSSDFKGKSIAGQAYLHKIVESDSMETFVRWSDSGDNIIPIPVGEIGINALAKFLATAGDENLKVMQRIGHKVAEMLGSSVPFEAVEVDAELVVLQAEYLQVIGSAPHFSFKNRKDLLRKKIDEVAVGA